MAAASKLIYTAAHGGFAGLGVPLGGGATISDWLADEWRNQPRFKLQLVTPAILGSLAPAGRDITRFNERAYARFCLAFSRAATQHILENDPANCDVLVNDISEAPDFARLAAAGFRIVTIYHVDVVDYIATIYLKGWLSAATLARTWQKVRSLAAPIAPTILKLIFERQRDSLLYSHCVVVPSEQMKSILLGAYPDTPPGRIEVVPWGVHAESAPESEIAAELASIRTQYGLTSASPVILCLSRISPEKGQDLLLDGLIELERQRAFQENPPSLLICGDPAFMRGQPHMDLLRRLASRLQRVRVHFPGHVTGARKLAMFRAAQVYAFPSRHESYGLTLAEALSQGLPSVAFDQPGSAEILKQGQGILVPAGPDAPVQFASEAAALLSDLARRAALSASALRWADAHQFRSAAARIASLLGLGPTSPGPEQR